VSRRVSDRASRFLVIRTYTLMERCDHRSLLNDSFRRFHQTLERPVLAIYVGLSMIDVQVINDNSFM